MSQYIVWRWGGGGGQAGSCRALSAHLRCILISRLDGKAHSRGQALVTDVISNVLFIIHFSHKSPQTLIFTPPPKQQKLCWFPYSTIIMKNEINRRDLQCLIYYTFLSQESPNSHLHPAAETTIVGFGFQSPP